MASSTSKGKTEATEALKQLTYLAAALKAPRITEAAGRLAAHARDAGWTHAEDLAGGLAREGAAGTPGIPPPRSSPGRPQPARHRVPSSASVPPGSQPARRSRSSTGTPNQP